MIGTKRRLRERQEVFAGRRSVRTSSDRSETGLCYFALAPSAFSLRKTTLNLARFTPGFVSVSRCGVEGWKNGERTRMGAQGIGSKSGLSRKGNGSHGGHGGHGGSRRF